MKTIEVDVAIIGAGTAGLAAYRAAKTAGAGATIIEGGDYGTTCARVGCMPSKLLIAAAEAAHAVGKAADFGIHVDGVIRVDGRAVMDRVRRERDRFVGLELGQALSRLGVRVVVLGRGGRVGPFGDPQILAYAIASFNAEFTLEPDAHIVSMQRVGDRVALRRLRPDDVDETEYFDYVLAATGRTPNVTGIGLEQSTLKLDAKGVPSFDPATTQTASTDGASPVFIAGDASNFIPLLHEAADEGRIAGENAARLALGKLVRPGLRRAPIGIVFTDPQIGIVGGGFRALKPGTFATGQVSFEDQGRSRILLRNKGLLNVYADLASGRFLGAEMLAPGAEHLAHLLAWALQNKMTPAQMLAIPFYHPVIEEGLRTALHDLNRKLLAAQTNIGKAV